MKTNMTEGIEVTGQFIDLDGERYYAIYNIDDMAPFFISVVSDSDHWLFVSSTGGLSAGRVSPETALFPYLPVDQIHESSTHTGCKTLIRVNSGNEPCLWEPFKAESEGQYNISRNLYKNALGNKLKFEEINHDLKLKYTYTWASSDKYGFVRQCEISNLTGSAADIELVDGFLNILPAGTPRGVQSGASNLVDAYKWTEIAEQTQLALYTLYAGISDRAEPCESLKANTVFCLGFDVHNTLLSSSQLKRFRQGEALSAEQHKKGIRGAYLVNQQLKLDAGMSKAWMFVANLEQSQSAVVALNNRLSSTPDMAQVIEEDTKSGSERLAQLMASADGFQTTDEENVAVHHYANVLFNTMRGGIFRQQYQISMAHFKKQIQQANKKIFARNESFLDSRPDSINIQDLLRQVAQNEDIQLLRLCYEYLPITFGRRHGDPSRPWNQFAINLKDEDGSQLIAYQGNWRDIFQNWEALTFSYPEFIESVISKFVNASTVDGYNPYRITDNGIDWEEDDPEDPWSYIGYWGDHQIIYLLKLLELSHKFHPEKLSELLRENIFCYANVPYRIKAYSALIKDPKDSVVYDQTMAKTIEQRVQKLGADGKMVLDKSGEVYLVNLFEKLLVPLLTKLSNLVVGGGIWLNTQRPEWNDANNALVGQGLSMVTLYYMRRYITHLQKLLSTEHTFLPLSREVGAWLGETAYIFEKLKSDIQNGSFTDEQRFAYLAELGAAGSSYRHAVYVKNPFPEKILQSVPKVSELLQNALAVLDHSIDASRRADGLYHAYNLMQTSDRKLSVGRLYAMLEGQVAVLSSGKVAPEQAVEIVNSLFKSDIYREDQQTFMLYPDRTLPSFLEKNQIPVGRLKQIPVVAELLEDKNAAIVQYSEDGIYRFNATLVNKYSLEKAIDELVPLYGEKLGKARVDITTLYEEVFDHQSFTGRSGSMFGFEGLGCIYWHMVAKLLLAVQEVYFTAKARNSEANDATVQLGQLYYKVRQGLGFNKTPDEYGAFPTDPYSHTPKHSGAQQPGMTGQVKEEVLTRFGELGVTVSKGQLTFNTSLLRRCEFLQKPDKLKYLDVNGRWQRIELKPRQLAFTWGQVPVVYCLEDSVKSQLTVTFADGSEQTQEALTLSKELSQQLFNRSGQVEKITLAFGSDALFN